MVLLQTKPFIGVTKQTSFSKNMRGEKYVWGREMERGRRGRRRGRRISNAWV